MKSFFKLTLVIAIVGNSGLSFAEELEWSILHSATSYQATDAVGKLHKSVSGMNSVIAPASLITLGICAKKSGKIRNSTTLNTVGNCMFAAAVGSAYYFGNEYLSSDAQFTAKKNDSVEFGVKMLKQPINMAVTNALKKLPLNENQIKVYIYEIFDPTDAYESEKEVDSPSHSIRSYIFKEIIADEKPNEVIFEVCERLYKTLGDGSLFIVDGVKAIPHWNELHADYFTTIEGGATFRTTCRETLIKELTTQKD